MPKNRLARRMNLPRSTGSLAGLDVLRIGSLIGSIDDGSIAGGGLDGGDGTISLSGDQILVYHADGSALEAFDADSIGLDAATAAAASGDVVWIPAVEISGDHTVPAGVTVRGLGEGSILSGALTNNGVLSMLYCSGSVTNNGILTYVRIGNIRYVFQDDAGNGFLYNYDDDRLDVNSPTGPIVGATQNAVMHLTRQLSNDVFAAVTGKNDGGETGTLVWGVLDYYSGAQAHTFIGSQDAYPFMLRTDNVPRVIVRPTTGRVGIKANAHNFVPDEQLHVIGNIKASGQLISALTTGTAPLSVVSTTLVTNLNADLLDGRQDTAFVHRNVADEFDTVGEKAAPIDADRVLIEDSADSLNKKWAQLGNLPSGDVADHDHSGDAGDGGQFALTNLTSTGASADDVPIADGAGGIAWGAQSGGGSLTVQEIDGTPSISNVTTIRVTNGTATDDGGGQVTLEFGSAASDGAAIHDNVDGEIHAITEKATPVDADEIIIEDSAASYAKKRVQIGNLPGGSLGNAVNLAHGMSYTLSPAPSVSYPDSAAALVNSSGSSWAATYELTDGRLGTLSYSDAAWMGWETQDPVIRLDMESATSGQEIKVWGLLTATGGVHTPVNVELEYSDDDANYTSHIDRALTDTSGVTRYWCIRLDISGAGSHRYWRLTFNQDLGWMFIGEIEFWG